MTHRLRPAVVALVVAVVGTATVGCSGTNAVNQSVSGSLGYGVGDQATTWIRPADRKAVTGVTGSLLTGDDFDLSRWRGRVVVVNFWGSWCGPCIAEAPALERVHRDTVGDGVEFLGVDVKEQGRAQAEAFVRAHHISYPMLYDESNLVALHFRGMAPNATPTTIVLDSQGRIAARHSGAILYTTLRDLVARVQRESAQ